MNLLHPWALFIGAAAVGLPVLIHWLTKPRPVAVPLSTIRFVREVVQQRRARYRLRDLLILLLRAAAVALLAWAFARPLTGAKPLVADAPGEAARVVILDRSQSMAAGTRGVQAFERARAAAAKQLGYAPGLGGNLILAGAKPAAVFPGLSTNFTAMQEALATARPHGEQLNLKAAIEQAADALGRAPQGARRELVVVSDFQRANWAAADFSALPADTRIQLESVAPAGEPPANLALLRVAPQGRVELGREARLEAEVGNYSATPRDVQVDVNVGGGISLRLSGHCPPGVRTTLTGEFVPRLAGWHAGEARLAGAQDALPADDVRAFVLDVRPTPTFALVTREAGKPRATSSHFLERALAPTKPRGDRPAERVVRIDAAGLDRDAVAGTDLIVLDHPGRLAPDAATLVASLLRRGRPVLYVAAEPADATNLGLIATAAGTDLKMPVQFVPPPAGQVRRNLFLASFRKESGLFGVFGDDATAALAPLRFAGGLSSRRLETGLADDVLATFSDQSAALVVTACGAGTLAVLNASLGDSNLPGSPAFVPLTGELVTRLLGRSRAGEAAPSGELTVNYLPPEAGAPAGLAVAPPEGADADTGELADDNGSTVWRWPVAGPPGAYAVRRGAANVFALATVIPAAEADLTPIDPALLKGRLAGGRSVSLVVAGEDESRRRDTRWAWVAAACAACMLCELVVLKLFRT